MALIPRGRNIAVTPYKQEPLMRWHVLNTLLESTRQQRFLEIGVQAGVCGGHVRASEKWGVDPSPRRNVPRKYDHFHCVESDQFFASLAPDDRFDVVFVDGLHHADQVLRDVDNSLRRLSDDGFVVLHDCNPKTEIAQRVPRETGVWNGDCWRAMVALRQRRDVDAFTIDADHGIGVVRKRQNDSPLTGVPQPLEYRHLEAERQKLLGLVGTDDWCRRVGSPIDLGRVVVVSAIFGRRDDPIPAPRHDVDEYVMFTDGDPARGWRTEHATAHGDPRTEARRRKTLALDMVDGDIIVWIDGRIRAMGIPLRPLLRHALRDADIAAFSHPWRACAYDEARECAQLGRADGAALQAQIEAYRAEGFPKQYGLWNTMVVARRRTDRMVELGRAWWQEIERRTVRDQVSLPYLLWKHGIRCGKLGDDVYHEGSSMHFVRGRHRRAA